MRRSRDWHISGWPAVVLAIVLSPLLALWALALKLKPFQKTSARTPGEVAGYIGDFLDGTGGEWDWDDFISVPITDPRLEAIRQEARGVYLPANEGGKQKLEELKLRARSLRPLS